jgi:hypothetical protein
MQCVPFDLYQCLVGFGVFFLAGVFTLGTVYIARKP